jgi:Fur family ferric uptake transcriptional regulator
MKKHKDLVQFLKSRGLRMTLSKELLIQFFLDNHNRHIPLREIHDYLYHQIPEVDRTTVYRNIEKFISLGLIQELDLPKRGKVFQYVFDKKVHHYFICKCCGRMNKGNEELFKKVEQALKDIHDFSKANLSVVFYGFCSKCDFAATEESTL